MIIKAFSLLDTKTGMFNLPFFLSHEGAAIRAVIDLGGDMNTTVGRHPADFQLYYIGWFDDQTGIMTPDKQIAYGTVLSLMPTRSPAPLFEDGADIVVQRTNGAQQGV